MAILLLALCAMLALPGIAQAGSVGLVEKPSPWGSGQIEDLIYRAGPHEHNRLRVSFTGEGQVRVVDPVGVRPGRHCARVSRKAVSCTADVGIDQTILRLGDGDDRARVGKYTYSYTAVLDGGSGDDLLISRSSFRDVFIGGPGDDTMTGVAFGETFDEGVRANGRDTMSTAYSGRSGLAWADYGERLRPIEADLDGERDDGEHGERDLLGRGVTSIRGGRSADHLRGDDAANGLVGGGGADVLVGGDGGDNLAATQAGMPIRSAGEDVPYSPTADRLIGGAGEDLIEGSTGPNQLDGGPGSDRILGLAGPDRIRAQDGDVDRVECGSEADRVWNDVIDFRADCESAVAFPPGAVPVVARSFFEENRYPGDPPPRWVAQVTVGCSTANQRAGSVDVLLDGSIAGTESFAIESPYIYAEVWVEVPGGVAALIKRRDPRVSVVVTTGASGVRRQASVVDLGKSVPQYAPLIPTRAD